MSGVRKRLLGRDRGAMLPTHTKGKARKGTPRSVKVFVFVVTSVVLYMAWNWYSGLVMRKMLYTPLPVPKVISQKRDLDRFWGSYRPQVYFGMKTQAPKSLVTGLMWLKQYEKHQRGQALPIRHTCEQGDNLPRYGWMAHDGLSFGIQDIVEREFVLRTEFVKRPGGDHGGDWSWRVTGVGAKDNVTLSLFLYVATDEDGSLTPIVEDNASGSRLSAIMGQTEGLGNFVVKFPRPAAQKKFQYHHTVVGVEGLHRIKDGVLRKMSVSQVSMRGGGGAKLPLYTVVKDDLIGNVPNVKSQVLVHQVTMATPFEIEMVYESGSVKQRSGELSGQVFTRTITRLKTKFDQKFEARFPMLLKGYNEEEVAFARAAFSNMIGGVGHFHGQSLVQSVHENEPVPYWDASLLTAVPSRSFFPRGFLWDEGFHELLISKWDQQLSLSVIGHWLDLMNAEGWIPREQILGPEARSKVPSEFVVQRNTNANPPTLFLAIQSIIDGMKTQRKGLTEADVEILTKMYPRLEAWFKWFNTTQTGPVPGSYRWRGREEDSDRELNPKTLTSGLDDYPRASHPGENERHVDLRCWIAFAADALAKIAKEIGADGSKYEKTRDYLTDNSILDEMHWSQELNSYADYGNHTDKVFLTKKLFQPAKPGLPPTQRVVREMSSPPKLGFVNARGYVSLFPFLLQIVDPASRKLENILQNLRNPDLLWTEFGLRSLAKSDPIYKKRNTEHDPPYWRGSIWININFLAVRALKYYSETSPAKVAQLAREIYAQLRTNLVKNIYLQHRRTGYIWENYNDETGAGQGSHPFTGWSALVVLMMSEQY